MAKQQKKRRIKQAQPVGGPSRQKVEPSAKVGKQAKSSVSTPKTKKRRIRAAGKAAAKPLKVFGIFKFLRFLVPPYVRNSWHELKQVTWPSRKETWKLTFAVFVFAITFGLLIGITDFGLSKVFERILLNL